MKKTPKTPDKKTSSEVTKTQATASTAAENATKEPDDKTPGDDVGTVPDQLKPSRGTTTPSKKARGKQSTKVAQVTTSSEVSKTLPDVPEAPQTEEGGTDDVTEPKTPKSSKTKPTAVGKTNNSSRRSRANSSLSSSKPAASSTTRGTPGAARTAKADKPIEATETSNGEVTEAAERPTTEWTTDEVKPEAQGERRTHRRRTSAPPRPSALSALSSWIEEFSGREQTNPGPKDVLQLLEWKRSYGRSEQPSADALRDTQHLWQQTPRRAIITIQNESPRPSGLTERKPHQERIPRHGAKHCKPRTLSYLDLHRGRRSTGLGSSTNTGREHHRKNSRRTSTTHPIKYTQSSMNTKTDAAQTEAETEGDKLAMDTLLDPRATARGDDTKPSEPEATSATDVGATATRESRSRRKASKDQSRDDEVAKGKRHHTRRQKLERRPPTHHESGARSSKRPDPTRSRTETRSSARSGAQLSSQRRSNWKELFLL